MNTNGHTVDFEYSKGKMDGVKESIQIAKELAEEYKTSFMEKLVEARKNCSENSDCSECPFGQVEDMCYLAELQIDAEEHNNGWIPVSEKLPNAKGWYLVTNILGIVQQQYWGTNHWSKLEDESVIAWQPLPPAYQPKGE